MNKTVFITGAASGIGKAAATLFATNGWNVVATMRNPAKELDLVKMENVLVIRLDVKDLDSIKQAVDAGIARFGKIDALINNAGFGQYGLFEAISRETVQQQFDVNVFGVMEATRGLLPHFRQNKGGMVINVSSGAGIYALPMISIYCASKFALEGFTESLSYELASQNIAVKLVIPHGGVSGTNFTQKAAKIYARDPSLIDYYDFAARTNESFARLAETIVKSAADVAKTIYEAATDGSDRFRYLVGEDTRGFIKAKGSLDDQEYINFMRTKFLQGVDSLAAAQAESAAEPEVKP